MTLKRIIIPVNASSLKLTHCKRKYFNTVCAGLISLDERDTLDLGTAIHRVAELKTKGMPIGQIISDITYSGPNGTTLVQAITTCPAIDPAYATELELTYDWREVVIDNVCYVIRLCLTIDHIMMRSDGYVVMTDYKTTSKSKPDDVFTQYRVSVQMRFYMWVLRRFAYQLGLPAEIAEACTLNHMFLRIHAIFKWGTPRWIMGSPITFLESDYDEFDELMEEQLKDVILPMWSGAFPSPNGKINETCQANYGCDFRRLCHAKNETMLAQEQLMHFTTRPYAPRYTK